MYHGHGIMAGSYILIKQPCVCLAQFFVNCVWISLFSSADILQKNVSGTCMSRSFREGNQ